MFFICSYVWLSNKMLFSTDPDTWLVKNRLCHSKPFNLEDDQQEVGLINQDEANDAVQQPENDSHNAVWISSIKVLFTFLFTFFCQIPS